MFSQVLLGVPRPLQQGGRAPVPHAGVLLPEGPAVPPEELGQRRVLAAVGPLVLQLSGESEVRGLRVRFMFAVCCWKTPVLAVLSHV